MPKIATLDLFSGIGGFSHALRSCCKTVAYCDIHPDCRSVLTRCMSKGLIDTAPIFEDVRLLKAANLRASPTLITAGSPCQDVSCANVSGTGLRGSQSSLVWEILRLSQSMPSVKYIFIENSPLLECRGFAELSKRLMRQGFRCVWGIFRASDVGALHERKRFFCLAYKMPLDVLIPQDFLASSEPCRRLVPRGTDHALNRCEMLGNSVVPQQVKFAWNNLVKHTRSQHSPVFQVKVQHSIPRTVKIEMIQGPIRFLRTTWPTPTKTRCQSQYHTLTERSTRMLSNALAFDKATQCKYKSDREDKFLLDKWHINPCFVEWLMGYPRDYTQF